MSYIDLAFGIALFILFFSMVLTLSIRHFVQTPATLTIEEYRQKAVDMLGDLFGKMGSPENWEDTGRTPSELGLIVHVYKVSISIEEPGISDRQNEPVIVKLSFDEECSNHAWNNTVRVYDSTLNETNFEFVNPVVCSSQYLNESYARFKVNISRNEKKSFYVYYYGDNGIPSPDYTITYSTASWASASGDDWTEAVGSVWSEYGGAGASPSANSTIKMQGTASIQIKDSFNSASALGLKYDPASSIIGVSNGWYLDAWLYVDDLSNVAAVNVSISDGSNVIMANVTGSMAGGEWYHIERNLSSSQWDRWANFDASNGIDNITFYMVNSSAGVTRQLKVDGVHFELRPLTAIAFPTKMEDMVSRKKVDALNNLTYSELKEATGEDFEFRIKITGS